MKKLLYILFHRSVFVGLSLIAQVVALMLMVGFFSEHTTGLYWFFIALSVAAALLIVGSRMEPAYKIAWLLLVLPFPNNPTGAIMERQDLEAIAEILRETGIMVLSDEIYAELTYGKRHVSIASLPDMRERTVLLSGFSKAYAMTGWRLGYLAAPAPLCRHLLKIHQYAIMCAPTTAQFAAVEALANGDGDIETMAAEYDRRRRYLVNRLRGMGIPCFEPEGAFYVWPNISGFGMNSEQFCEKLLYEYGVAIVPGNAFGDCGEGFARISYAYSIQHIDQALTKIQQMVTDIRTKK